MHKNSTDLSLPVAERLPNVVPVEVWFKRLQAAGMAHCLWLDSVLNEPDPLGRYSFLTADPVDTLCAWPNEPNPWPRLSQWLNRLPDSFANALPPFQGGIAGLFGYEAAHWLEEIEHPQFNDLPTPALCLGLYDWVIAIDHTTQQRWLVSQGIPETDLKTRYDRACDRAAQVRRALEIDPCKKPTNHRLNVSSDAWPSSASKVIPADALAPQFSTPRDTKLTSDFSSPGYRHAVAAIVDGIRDGDCFQVNLSQRLLFPQQESSSELYLRLRQSNPAPFAGFFDAGCCQILSSSPEMYLRVRDRNVETRPIKGTVPRSSDPHQDAALIQQLKQSAKDRAENVMIVDLLRNDLSRTCEDPSVQVSKLCAIEPYAFVHHLVSVVQGRLRSDASVVDLLTTSFPGGSVTGAPKIEAMQTIGRLEPTARGPYCGTLGYLGCGGQVDLNILIRTVTAAHGWLQIPVGGGVTASSLPEQEEEETWHKAEGMLRAVLP